MFCPESQNAWTSDLPGRSWGRHAQAQRLLRKSRPHPFVTRGRGIALIENQIGYHLGERMKRVASLRSSCFWLHLPLPPAPRTLRKRLQDGNRRSSVGPRSGTWREHIAVRHSTYRSHSIEMAL